MNGDHKEEWQEINRLRIDAARQEERMSQVEKLLSEIKEIAVDLSAKVMTRDACSERHGRLETAMTKHLETTEGVARRLREKVLGWGVVGILAAIAGYAAKGVGL